MPLSDGALSQLSREIKAGFTKNKPTAEDFAIKSNICETLQSSVDLHLKNSELTRHRNVFFKIFMFGSSVTGLGDANADLDLGEIWFSISFGLFPSPASPPPPGLAIWYMSV